MMKVLVLGGSGMLGHKLWQTLSSQHDVRVTFRRAVDEYARLGIFDPARSIEHVAADNFDSVMRTFAQARPDVVLNCIGIVKQGPPANDRFQTININALFPHRLAKLCCEANARLIHISTDCVFSGRAGRYKESDNADAEDLYGRTKFLGEIHYANCLTIRSSMIGRELSGTHGLLEWFIAQNGKTVRGFKRAIFSGFTTTELSKIIREIVESWPTLSGVWHVAAEPISKFDLLSSIKQALKLDIEIEPDETFVCDRSLDGSRFQRATGFRPSSWDQMIEAMAQDTTPYEQIRRTYAGR